MSVYFIKPVGMAGPIKIGCSFSPDGRRRTLETWSPFPLEIVAEVPGDQRLEMRFHARFLADHRRHEWFAWSVALQAVIDTINDGTFDFDSLPAPARLPRAPGDKTKIPWSPERRLGASYRFRFAATAKKFGLHYDTRPNPCEIEAEIASGNTEIIALADKMLADPHSYCITHEEYCARIDAWNAERRYAA